MPVHVVCVTAPMECCMHSPMGMMAHGVCSMSAPACPDFVGVFNCRSPAVHNDSAIPIVFSLFFGHCLFYTKPYFDASGQESIESSGPNSSCANDWKNLFFAMGNKKTHKGTKAGPILYVHLCNIDEKIQHFNTSDKTNIRGITIHCKNKVLIFTIVFLFEMSLEKN